MDCRGDELIQHNNRTSAQAVPFQYLINEQAKSILALQELQNEVGALLEFRDLVMDTFPHLRQKQVSSPEPSSGSQGVGSGESRWEPGVRVRRKLGSSSGWIAGGGLATNGGGTGPRSRCNSHGKGPKSGEPATTSVGTVQDSGFCTESKDSSSTSSRTTATMTKTGGAGGGGGSGGGSCGSKDDEDDELWSLLEVIQDKGTKLKLEAEFLQSRLLDDERLRRGWRPRFRRCRSLDDLLRRPALQQLQRRRHDAVADDCCDYDVFRAHVTDLKRERDALLDRVTEMEAESLSNAAQIHRLLVELKSVVCENRELEERLCGGGVGVGGLGAKSSSATSTAKKSSSHNGGGGGFAPVQPESSTTGPSSSSAGRDAYYTPSQHSACNLSSIELQCKQCPSAASSSSSAASSLSAATTDDNLLLNRHHHHHHHHNNNSHHRSRRMLLVRPSDPISRNLEGRAASPPPPAVDIGSPTFAKRLGALDGIVSSPAERIGKPVPGCGQTAGTPLPRGTLAAILKTFNPIELQRHLITVSYENKNLVRQVEILSKSKSDVTDELNRSKDDNEELKFQLEEKRIELEGTMARVRLLQLHQEQQQHGPNCGGGGAVGQQQSTTTTTNQWLDLVPSNPILPQIALPGTPVQSAASPSHHHHQNGNQQQQIHNNSNSHNNSNNNGSNHHHLQHHHQDENGGSSSTESAHQARSGGKHNQPSKIPVVKSYSSRPPSSYRDPHHHHHHQQPANRDPYPSWNKCKSDQSYPRNWDPIGNGGKSNGSASSIGSGGGGGGKTYRNRQQDSLQDGGSKQHLQHRTSRRDSGSGGGTSLTRAKSQSNHHLRSAANCNPADNRTSCKDLRAGGGTAVAVAPSAAADDTNKPAKKLFRRRNLVRQSHCLIDQKKLVLPAVDEVQEPPDSMAVAAQQLRDFRRDDGDTREDDCRGGGGGGDDDDDDGDEFFFDSIESSLATSASSRRPPPECDSIDLSQPDSSLTVT